MTKDQVRAIMEKAARTNAERDQIERKTGFAPPGDGPLDMTFRTVMLALDCALQTEDWDCVAEALHMLSEAEIKYRPKTPDGHGKTFQPWLREHRG